VTSLELQTLFLAVRTQATTAQRQLAAIVAQCEAAIAVLGEAGTESAPTQKPSEPDDCSTGRHPSDLLKRAPLMGRPNRKVCMGCGATLEG
jgi:hypothetical protein